MWQVGRLRGLGWEGPEWLYGDWGHKETAVRPAQPMAVGLGPCALLNTRMSY